MTKKQIERILSRLEPGHRFPGTASGKFYVFGRIQKYKGRGKYAHLNEADVVVLHSEDRKRSKIILFFEPLLVLVNSDQKDLRYGNLPSGYISKFRNGGKAAFPNLHEYESHYKCLARHIQLEGQEEIGVS